MKIGIICAMPSEMDYFSTYLEGDYFSDDFISPSAKGIISGHEIIAVQSGIGKVNAARCATIMCAVHSVDYVINIGIAGGMSEKVHHLDTVIVSSTSTHDVDSGMMGRYFPFETTFKCDERLIGIAKDAVKTLFQTQPLVGSIVSGDNFIASDYEKQKILAKYAPLCVDMESSAIGQVCSTHDTPFLVVRTISDSADDSADTHYDEFEKLSADRSGKILEHMINNL